MVVVVVRCPADPIQQDEKGCGGQGWGVVGQVMLQSGVPPSSGTPKAAHTPEAEACGVGEGNKGSRAHPVQGPPATETSPNPAWHTSLREGQRRGAVLTRWPSL